MKAAVAMVIGPGKSDIGIETPKAILDGYPDSRVWCRDDATDYGRWECVRESTICRPAVLIRNASPCGYLGLPRSIASLFTDIAEAHLECVIKGGPDAMVLGPGLDFLFREHFSQHGSRMCGSYHLSAAGIKRNVGRHARRILIDCLPIGPTPRGEKVRVGNVFYASFLLRALGLGYSLAEHALGGLYAQHGETLNRLIESGFRKALSKGRYGSIREEEVLIALGVKSVSDTISPINDYASSCPLTFGRVSPITITSEQMPHPDCWLCTCQAQIVNSENVCVA